jgi:hypothetical protein
MSPTEARRALGEMRVKVGDEHAREVERMLEAADEKADDEE